ncbi:isopenicillin N synthase family oxygenase [Chitinimonas arctica]|uniref:2-oxoglutarate-dependent ethylene/succinate-forming enzyme n=1 Tax=Chitinimonas arctica TaxID=2594795 RepID=A0A516SLB5_9NEIS|nr:2OG-Fe(II) oxygenase family protein [Chitinimonas arctica]QDQ28935.1 isopenicillin N synthase family oxygenase [Chitinimonas arctica]
MHVQTVDYRSNDAPGHFVTSLRETGFAVLVNHPLPTALIGDIYRDWLDFFNGEAKQDYRFDPERQDGWFSTAVSETAKGSSIRDLKEFYHVFTWGRIPTELRDNALAYQEVASTLAAELLGWIEQCLPAEVTAGLSEPLSGMITASPNNLLRVLRYPPLSGDEAPGSLRAAAHEDINLITLLPAANAPGLEVRDRQGNWHAVSCEPGTMVVNVGDMLQEATAGWLPSTSHRVTNPTGEDARQSRISLPLFLHPRSEVVLSERHTADSYLNERLRELGIKK